MDFGGTWVMLKIMTAQENAKIGEPVLKNPTKKEPGLTVSTSGPGDVGGGAARTNQDKNSAKK